MTKILETERLVLRQLTLNDTAFIIELVNSPGWLTFIGDRNIHTEEDAIGYLVHGPIKSYQTNGFGLSMVELKSQGTPIGICGILKRESLDHPDIGFAFLEAFTGQGYAQEIAAATVAHAKNVLELPVIMAITKPENDRSIKLLGRIGFRKLPGNNEELITFIS